MFDPRGISAIAPRPAPIFPALEAGTNLGAYLEGLRCTNATTQGTALAIILKAAEAALSTTVSELRTNCRAMFHHNAAESIATSAAADPVDAANPTDVESMTIRALSQVESAQKWICELVNASKKKELTGTNVESYYSALGRSDVNGTPIAMLINKMANFLPDMINDDTFRNNLTDNMWNKYHMSRVASGKLLYKIREDLINLNILERGSAADTAIVNCATNSHNVELSYDIPEKLIGYGSLYYEVAGIDVGDWKQGGKAEANLPATKVKAIKQIFKKYMELRNSVDAVKDATTVGALNTAVGNSFW